MILGLGAFRPRRPSGLLFGVALAAVAAAFGATVLLPGSGRFAETLEVGGYARFFTFLLLWITLISLLLSYQYGRVRNMGGDEYYGLLLLAGLGMILVAGAVNWLVFLLGLEVLSVSLYILIAIRKEDPASSEAGLKYFILGAVASSFLTFGIALLYAATGTLDISGSLAARPPAGMSLPMAGFTLLITGIGFKISMVPFHLWTPDVYQGAPTPVTAFLSTGSKVALLAALLRFAQYSESALWAYFIPALWILALLTMVVGNVSALTQERTKRLLAYSSVAQMGYLLMALVAAKHSGPPAVMFYLAAYALMDLGAFGALAMLSPADSDLDDLQDLRGLAYSSPWRAVLLTASLISLAGLPPTVGFIGKFALFQAVLQDGFVILAVIGILTVIVSIYVYLRVVATLFMQPALREWAPPGITLSEQVAYCLVIILLFWLGLAPAPLFRLITQSWALLST